MIVYRITKKEHTSLDGMGGLYGPGRWHRKGSLVIYASEHASLAAWEKIVHVASFENLSTNLLLVKIEIPDQIEIQTVPPYVLIAFLLAMRLLAMVLPFCKIRDTWHSKYLQLLSQTSSIFF